MTRFTESSGETRRSFRVAVRAEREALLVTSLTHRHRDASGGWVRMVRTLYAMFLPDGYPNSVSSDYLTYQKYDTLQALCSSVTGTLSTRSILRGVGVGEATATAVGGTMQWVIRDGAGRIGHIIFASKIASDLDHDAKRWRFVADITNDVALMLDIFSTHLPQEWWLVVICIAALFRAVTQVAGGATRASLTQHFAIRDNTADVSAKDGSQETLVNLIGMFLGMFVAWAVPETLFATAVVFAVFTSLHLWANYRGVKNLVLKHLNEARANICLHSFPHESQLHYPNAPPPPTPPPQATEGFSPEDDPISPKRPGLLGLPNPEAMRKIEPVLGRLTGYNPDVDVVLGESVYDVLERCHGRGCSDAALVHLSEHIEESLFANGYAVVFLPHKRIFVPHSRPRFERARASVILVKDATPNETLQGWALAKTQSNVALVEGVKEPHVLIPSKTFREDFDHWTARLVRVGWRLDRLQLRVSDWRVNRPTLPEEQEELPPRVTSPPRP